MGLGARPGHALRSPNHRRPDESLTILGQLGDRYTVLVGFQDADALLFGTSVTLPVRGFAIRVNVVEIPH